MGQRLQPLVRGASDGVGPMVHVGLIYRFRLACFRFGLPFYDEFSNDHYSLQPYAASSPRS